MEQKYSKSESIPRNSVSNTKEFDIQNNNIVVKQNNINENNDWLRKLTQKWDYCVYTLSFLFAYLIMGLGDCIFAPTMVDMRFLFHSSMANIGYSSCFACAGALIGALFGFLYKYLNRQLSFIISMAMVGVFTGIAPLCTSLWQFYGAFFLGSVGCTVFGSGNTVWLVEMWGEGAPPLFQLSQMMYGIGCIISPLMVEPFVYGDLSNKTKYTSPGPTSSSDLTTLYTTTASSNSTSDDDINNSVDRRSKLMIPYLVTGVLTLISPTVLLIMFIIKRYKTPEKQKHNEKTIIDQATNPDSATKPEEVSPLTRKILIALVALSIGSWTGVETSFFSYVSSYYQYLPIHLSANTGAFIMSVMTSTYTAGRGVSAFVSTKLSPEVMLMYHLVIVLLSLAVLYLGQNSRTFIYLGNAMIGFGFSAVWSAYFALSEKYIGLTNKVSAIYSLSASLVGISVPFALGPLIDNRPQLFLVVVMSFFSSVVFLFIIIMVILKRSKRYLISYTVNCPR